MEISSFLGRRIGVKCSMERALAPCILFSMAALFFFVGPRWSSYPAVLVGKVAIASVSGGFGSSAVEERFGGRRIGGECCDLFEGKWVWEEEGYPLYQSKDCPFLDEGFRCAENGRPDRLYTKWRWKPNQCDLPRFDAKNMLEMLRNRRVVFAGDSIGRNQWESLFCMLASAEADKGSICEVNGSPITKHKGFLVFRFRNYNFTLEYFRSPFLIRHGSPPRGLPQDIRTTLKLDIMDIYSSNWRNADVLVLNTGHWWNIDKTIRGGHFFQIGREVKMNMSVETAYHISIKTLFDWINKEVNTSKTHVFFRSYSPVHFRNGDWKNGGKCHDEILPESNHFHLQSNSWVHFHEPLRNILSIKNSSGAVDLLNITYMSALRKDGHQSLYYTRPANLNLVAKEDCSHWCLPGVPDAWNEILYAFFLKREYLIHQNLSSSSHTKEYGFDI